MIDLEWLTARQKLFEKFCLPSVLSQTNKNFEWVLIADTRTPDSFRQVLNSYPATVIYWEFDFDFSSLRTKHKQAIRMEELSAYPVRDYLKGVETDWIITSRLDNDDAISVDHIDKIQTCARRLQPRGMPFWLNLQRGYKWCSGNVYPIGALQNPFISMVEKQGELLTAYIGSHKVAHKHARIEQIREGHPTWMQVIHGGNLLNKLMRYRGEMPFSNVRNIFKIKENA